jgi:broad specificity phosphatase PhoE
VTRLYLVRHGQAAAGWSEDADPGLSPTGRAQAEAAAARLAPLGPLRIVTSPLRRAQETAAPLARTWGVTPRIDTAVAEIPSPTDDLAERGEWLMGLFGQEWDDWPEDVQEWRRGIARTLVALAGEDTVVFTHFVFIAQAVGDPDFMPDNCSVTVLDVGPDGAEVVARGAARSTQVL